MRLTMLGLVCGQTTMAHIAHFAGMHWPVLKEPLGFLRDHIRALPNGQFLLCGSPEDSMPVSPLSLLEVGDGKTVRVVEADCDVPETDIFREALQANLRG